nr:MAG TPA: TMEM125 protein family protein [Caudoviricetes sp.]
MQVGLWWHQDRDGAADCRCFRYEYAGNLKRS